MPDYPQADVSPGAFDNRQAPSITSLEFAVRYNTHARSIFLPAKSADLTTATAGAFTTSLIGTVEMADAVTSSAVWPLQHPVWSSGRPINMRLFFAQSGTAAGAFRFDFTMQLWLATNVMTAGSPQVTNFTTSNVTVTAVANALQIYELAIPAALTNQLPSDHFASFRVRRIGGNAADTCTDVARIVGVQISHL